MTKNNIDSPKKALFLSAFQNSNFNKRHNNFSVLFAGVNFLELLFPYNNSGLLIFLENINIIAWNASRKKLV